MRRPPPPALPTRPALSRRLEAQPRACGAAACVWRAHRALRNQRPAQPLGGHRQRCKAGELALQVERLRELVARARGRGGRGGARLDRLCPQLASPQHVHQRPSLRAARFSALSRSRRALEPWESEGADRVLDSLECMRGAAARGRGGRTSTWRAAAIFWAGGRAAAAAGLSPAGSAAQAS